MSESTKLGHDEKFCGSCGNVVKKEAEICPKCGVRLKADEARSWVVALLLCFFLGIFGVHRFYTGSIVIGVVQLLTLGMLGIWTIIDFILILLGVYKDANGNYLKK